MQASEAEANTLPARGNTYATCLCLSRMTTPKRVSLDVRFWPKAGYPDSPAILDKPMSVVDFSVAIQQGYRPRWMSLWTIPQFCRRRQSVEVPWAVHRTALVDYHVASLQGRRYAARMEHA
ncbi:MAG: hypothetical protein JWR21_1122 [Herminiimonas sp.]|nr:hypothetical protein [Herminiimonas sp.]